MNKSSEPSVLELLASARSGSLDCLGQLLEFYANYLKLLVTSQLGRQLQVRVSPSDVVQETFFEAHRDFRQFRGQSTEEFLAWLRRITVNNMYRASEKHLRAEKRDVRREVSLERMGAALEQSTVRLDAILADRGASPSGKAQRQEMQILVADQIADLPEAYRNVIVMRHLEGMSFEEIGQQMDRTAGAARMLWLRAMRQLRERLKLQGMT